MRGSFWSLFFYLLHICTIFGEEVPEEEEYRLQIGDRLQIELFEESSSKKIVTIDPSGSIQFMYAQGLVALDKTVRELKEDLQRELGRYLRDPLVGCALLEVQGNWYTIVGEVSDPGTKPLSGPTTILDAISDAKGITVDTFRDRLEDMAELDHSFLARRGEAQDVDFFRLIRMGDMRQNWQLEPGDYLYIPSKKTRHIYVLGDVKLQSAIDTFHSISLMEAVAQAGGTTLRASSRVLVLRGSLTRPTRYLIDFNRICKGYAPDFPLEHGDIVYVPPRKFATLEEILKAGVSVFVSSVLTWAGQRTFYYFEPRAAEVLSGASSVVAPVTPGSAAGGGP